MHEVYDLKGSWIDRHTDARIDEGRFVKDTDLHKKIILGNNFVLSCIFDAKIYDRVIHDSNKSSRITAMDYSVMENPRQMTFCWRY